MSGDSKSRFIEQQGFSTGCDMRFGALMVQPWIVATLVAIGVITQSPWVFLAVAALSFPGAFFPRWNPFEAVYNAAIARPRGLPPLTPAPAPRRFAQGMAGTFLLGIGLSLLGGLTTVAWVLEGLLIVALASLLFGRFCLGSYVFHVLRGKAGFANKTVPWARG